MDISAVLSAVVRRWYVALLVLILTGVAAQQLWQSAQPEYTSTTTMTVLPTKSLMQARAKIGAGDSSLGNPFGVEANTVLAALLAESINNDEIALPESTGNSQVAVVADSSLTPKPYFDVIASSDTPEGANLALRAAAEQSVSILSSIQSAAGAPREQLYTALRTRPESATSIAYPERNRSVLGVVLAGILAAALLSVATDAAFRSRSRRRLA